MQVEDYPPTFVVGVEYSQLELFSLVGQRVF